MAEITHTRGKVRYIYDLGCSLTLEVKEKMTAVTYKATLALESIMNPDLEDVDLNLTWSGNGPNGGDRTSIQALLLKEGQFRDLLKVGVQQFDEQFRAL
jgi:hypothetical protein